MSFDIVARELAATGMTVVLRSGGYLFHDHGLYRKVTPAARGVAGAPGSSPPWSCGPRWCPVPSPAWPCSARAAATPASTPACRYRCASIHRGGGAADLAGQVTALNDQHAYLELDPDTALAPGDLVCLGISHPCTTLDKWRLIPVLDDSHHVTDVVHTFF